MKRRHTYTAAYDTIAGLLILHALKSHTGGEFVYTWYMHILAHLCIRKIKFICMHLHECVQLHRSPYILINAVQANFTHGSKRRLFSFCVFELTEFLNTAC